MVANLPEVRGKPGRPRSLPDELYADRAYDSEPVRTILRWLGIKPLLAMLSLFPAFVTSVPRPQTHGGETTRSWR
jgi:hypothetical protein